MTLPTITATGNLGADPDLRVTPQGKAVVSLSVACNKNKKTEGGEWETVSTTWLRVSLWDTDAEVAAEHLKKGDAVTVTGQLNLREYDKDGQKRLSPDVENARVSKNLPRTLTQRTSSPAAADPWAQQPAAQSTPAGWDTADKPPF